MFKRKHKIEVVPEGEYTDFSSREEYASKETFIVAALVPTVAILGYKAFASTDTAAQTIPVTAPVAEPINVLAQSPTIIPVSSPEVIPTGFIADSSLEMLATVLDPLLDIMVAISFPIASVIMVGACFMFMFNNSEKAWDMIMKAGLGYVLVQMSPLFLEILRQVGKAV